MVALLPVPVRADAEGADRAAAAALDAAQHDRNAEAVVLYQQAIALDPERRKLWLWKLAEQLTWASREKEAIPLFREALAGGLSGDDERWARLRYALALRRKHQFREAIHQCDALLAKNPNDIDALMGRAETLSWWDRNRSAKKEYEAVLRLDPSNQEARRSLARVQAWRNQKQDAQQRVLLLLRDHLEDAQGTFLLAQIQDWMGRPDNARRTLHDFLAAHPAEALRSSDRTDIQHLLSEIERRGQPDAGTDYQFSDQSDRLNIGVESLWQDVTLQDGRTTVGPRFQRYDYNPGQGQPSLMVNRPGIFGRHRFNDKTELTANLNADLIEPPGTQKSHAALTYDTYATLWPSDKFRFDLGSSRVTFDNITSLSRGITGTYANFSIDYLPEENTRLTTRANWGGYSDGNERRWTQIEAERRVLARPALLVGARYTSFGFSKQVDDGYFNPNAYHSEVATLHLSGNQWQRLNYDLEGAYGRESSNPGGARPYSSLGARLTYQIGKRLEIQGRYGFFSSREASSGGFARHTTGVYLRFVM